ncbi:MAG: DEAD/DEAH box helicase, partial [Myxococcota bacterium]
FLQRLREIGLQPVAADEYEYGDVRLAGNDLRNVVRLLVEEGWRVEADGEPIRAGGQLRAKVTSGIDWFDLEAELEYEGSSADLPELLAAARSNAVFVRLKDGSKGLAPDWLRRYASAAKVGKVDGVRLRFLPSQAGVIDALMTGHDEATTDVKFDRLLSSLKQGTWRQVKEPAGFKGTLRDYQREGLGWMKFLQDFKYGGCLADDMGLGKTVQVLAMLQGRHRPGGKKPRQPRPSLIVVPRSLVFNWIKEAGKFCPDLRGTAYRGPGRAELREHLDEYDFVVTTYGTLRQDILHFLEYRFECVILDEAQSIKNPKSQAAKACRLLQAEHKLAISGTPIENGLDELWSLFEFLNPGMLGSMDTFAVDTKAQDESWLELLSQSLRPFMLRRTKTSVLKDLPEKTEQHMYVELNEEDRANYEELRRYYRNALSSKIASIGLAKSKVHVLEALLRLRQAACHPALIDSARADEGSSKIDLLFENLESLIASGHKALVFSQFTELLEICRRRLVALDIDHEYLDGGTRDRQAGVDRFQSDDNKKVFLISLKAGGCGLTLTASDYVFILDPWWNPAVEAQAVDRAYRMGQTRPVFAYRMIARDTVEEKIVALQDEKRRLADAIIGGGGGPISDLTAEDIEKLFG